MQTFVAWMSRVAGAVFGGVQAASTFVQEHATPDNVELALKWARIAAQLINVSDAQRREFVVKGLISRGLSENVARLLVEVAVGLLKRERGQERA